MTASRGNLSRQAIEEVYGATFMDGNIVSLLYSGEGAIESVTAAIESARSTVCLQFYIYRNDTTGEALAALLAKKASEGVKVRLIYDHLGSLGTPRAFWRRLEALGIEVRASHPFMWLTPWKYTRRDHRKLLIVDGTIAFTGGLNIADEYWGFALKKAQATLKARKPWRDTGIMMKGPAAWALYNEFFRSWEALTIGKLMQTREPVEVESPGSLPVLPIFASSGRLRRQMRKLLYFSIMNAKSDICLTTAYFTPSWMMLDTLEQAVRRGVRVRLLLPETSDVPLIHYTSRYFYSRLLRAGVEIYNYRGRMLHAKTYIFDRLWSIVGSANLDFRSLRHNDEGNVGIIDEGFAEIMVRKFEEDITHSARIVYEEWHARPLWQKAVEWVVTLFRRKL